MRYNYIEQRPDYYNVREYDSADIESLKEQIKDNYPNQFEQFESVNYSPYDYMYKRLYDSITDESERWGVVCLLLEYSPLRGMLDYNSVLTDLNALELKSIQDEKKLCYLFFCESEEDFWDYFAIGYGDIKDLYHYYLENDFREKITPRNAQSRAFLLYLYHKTLDLEEDASSKIVTRGVANKERKRRVSILSQARQKALKLLMDDFDLSDILDAQMAWDTQILEIRQEFVKDENLPMLKKILNNHC